MSTSYGKVKFIKLEATERTAEDYEKGINGKKYDLTRFENYNKLVEGSE